MMNLIPKPKSDPFSELHHEIDSVFSRFAPSLWRDNFGSNFFGAQGHVTTAIDIQESGDEVQVRAEIPGLEKEQISIDINGKTLTLSGEKRHEEEKKEKNYYWKECSFGKFGRQIVLPAEVDSEKSSAEYKNGVLTIRLPKVENARRKRIEVKVN